MEYDTFLGNLSELQPGVETEMTIRDCETYNPKVVKAIVSPNSQDLPGGDILLCRAKVGHLLDKSPWTIKIIEVLGEVGED